MGFGKCSYLLMIIIFCIDMAAASIPPSPLLDYIQAVMKHSPQMEIKQSEMLASKAKAEFLTLPQAWTTQFRIQWEEGDYAPTFGTSRYQGSRHTLAVETAKRWSVGVTTFGKLEYTERDDRFVGETSSASLGVKFKPFVDFGKAGAAYLEQLQRERTLHTAQLSYQQELKNHILLSLLTLSEYLQMTQDFAFQEALCKQSQKAQDNVRRRFQRGALSKRDYLLGERDVLMCERIATGYQKTIPEKISQIQTTFGVNPEDFKLDPPQLYQDLRQLFSSLRETNHFDPVQTQNNRLLRAQREETQAKFDAAKAKSRVDLEVSLSVRYDSFDSGSGELFDTKYPVYLAGITLPAPWDTSAAKIEASTTAYSLQNLKLKEALQLRESQQNFIQSENKLRTDFILYENYLAALRVSQQLEAETKKDFQLGKVDFRQWSDALVQLIGHQKELSNFRLNLIRELLLILDDLQLFSELTP